MKYDKYHAHEIKDRIHIICSMIDDFLIDQPSMNENANKKCQQAQKILCEVMDSQQSLIDNHKDILSKFDVLYGKPAKEFVKKIKENKNKKVPKEDYERAKKHYENFVLVDDYIYMVTMYKYGERNEHSYVLGVYQDKELSIQEANKEADARGNKYFPEILGIILNEKQAYPEKIKKVKIQGL